MQQLPGSLLLLLLLLCFVLGSPRSSCATPIVPEELEDSAEDWELLQVEHELRRLELRRQQLRDAAVCAAPSPQLGGFGFEVCPARSGPYVGLPNRGSPFNFSVHSWELPKASAWTLLTLSVPQRSGPPSSLLHVLVLATADRCLQLFEVDPTGAVSPRLPLASVRIGDGDSQGDNDGGDGVDSGDGGGVGGVSTSAVEAPIYRLALGSDPPRFANSPLSVFPSSGVLTALDELGRVFSWSLVIWRGPCGDPPPPGEQQRHGCPALDLLPIAAAPPVATRLASTLARETADLLGLVGVNQNLVVLVQSGAEAGLWLKDLRMAGEAPVQLVDLGQIAAPGASHQHSKAALARVLASAPLDTVRRPLLAFGLNSRPEPRRVPPGGDTSLVVGWVVGRWRQLAHAYRTRNPAGLQTAVCGLPGFAGDPLVDISVHPENRRRLVLLLRSGRVLVVDTAAGSHGRWLLGEGAQPSPLPPCIILGESGVVPAPAFALRISPLSGLLFVLSAARLSVLQSHGVAEPAAASDRDLTQQQPVVPLAWYPLPAPAAPSGGPHASGCDGIGNPTAILLGFLPRSIHEAASRFGGTRGGRSGTATTPARPRSVEVFSVWIPGACAEAAEDRGFHSGRAIRVSIAGLVDSAPPPASYGSWLLGWGSEDDAGEPGGWVRLLLFARAPLLFTLLGGFAAYRWCYRRLLRQHPQDPLSQLLPAGDHRWNRGGRSQARLSPEALQLDSMASLGDLEHRMLHLRAASANRRRPDLTHR